MESKGLCNIALSMTYSTLNKTKFGDCCQCHSKDTNVIKVAKLLYCTFCHQKNKAKKQLQKQKEISSIRSLIGKQGNNELTEKEKWFRLVRIKLTGTCQCGCARKTSKYEDAHFRSSCAHVFPQRLFKSIQFHPLNWVERNFWEGCHTNMDSQSMDKWVNMADWDNIVEIFHELAPLLTDEERAHKFYGHLERLVYQNK